MSGGCDRGGRRGRRRRRRSRYRGAFHRQPPAALLVLDPRPLQSADQGVAKILGEEAINVERD